jgi:hypothetical protein
MKVQNIFALVLALGTITASAFPSHAKGGSGGGRSSSSSPSRTVTNSPTRSGTSNFGSSKSSSSTSTGSKSSGANAFSRGPSTATKAVATQKASSLNSSTKPLTQSQLASSGVKSTKPSDLGMSTTDTTRLSAMQTQHNALQSIPESQRNLSNPVYKQQYESYNRDRVIILNQYPTAYIPAYGYGAPYSGGYVQHVQPADEASGFEKFLNFLGKLILLGIGGTIAVLIGVAAFSFFKEWKAQKEAQKALQEEAKRRF